MPITKSAKKKLRQDEKRRKNNTALKNLLKSAIKEAAKKPSEATVKTVQKIADKAAKLNIIHKNKAARIKSRFTKLTSVKK